MTDNRKTDEEQRITRQYAIDHDAFMEFFKIEGEFQNIEIMTTKTTSYRSKDGSIGFSSVQLSGVKPWIRITTKEDTTNFTEDKSTDDRKGSFLA